MEQQELHLTVNGEDHTLACDPDVPLLDVLRAELGLAGPRFGCGLGLCGACMVIIDGKARSSCDYPAWAAEGTEVTTVEGLRHDGALHVEQGHIRIAGQGMVLAVHGQVQFLLFHHALPVPRLTRACP